MREMIFLLILASVGCGENRGLDLILQEATKPSSAVVAEGAACYKGVSVDATTSEYAFRFDKDCLDTLLMGDNWTVESVSAMVKRDDFRLEGKRINLTGEVSHRNAEHGFLFLKPSDENVDFSILPRGGAASTAKYQVGRVYTFEVFDIEVDREWSLEDVPQYRVTCWIPAQ